MRFAQAVCLVAGVSAATQPLRPRVDGSLSSWLAAQDSHSLQGILDNLGADGSGAQGANAGLVVASPSKSNPDYFYTWTRDSALTFKCLIDQWWAGHSELEPRIQQYISAQANLQTVANPSGALCSGGLGEPKFEVDGTAFTGNWGRPQRDGPALRATALIAYGQYLIASNRSSLASSIVWPIVSNDLSYVSQYWNQSTFDLWEEVNSASFFTTAAQYRALIEGSAFAQQLGQTCAHCDSQAPLILCALQSYWTGSYMLANTGGGRSGKDANSLLASIHMFDPAAPCDATTFQPCSDKALANHKVVTDSFRAIYALNAGSAPGQGAAIGRYPEDVYQGGNPWYLSNFAAAEQLHDAAHTWTRLASLQITPTSLAFFQDVYPPAAVGTYAADTPAFDAILAAVRAYADSYLAVAQAHTPASLDLAEQFSRSDGTPLSAVDLTWSYAALLTANKARQGVVPNSWGAARARLPGGRCASGSATGPCAAATRTVWAPCTTPSLTAVTFNELRTTAYGQSVLLVGSVAQLGEWDASKAVPLRADKYSNNYPLWSATVSLPVGSSVQYKFIQKQADGSTVWESDPNRSYTVPGSCSGRAHVDTSWR